MDERHKKYAELIVKVGIGLKENQTLVLTAPVETAEFARLVVDAAYDAGAGNVHVEWADQKTALIKYKKAPDETLKHFPKWKAKGFEEFAQQNAAFLTLLAPNPDLLKSVSAKKMAMARKAQHDALKDYLALRRGNKVSWSGAAVPCAAWADKVFPEIENGNERIEKLWETVLKMTRSDVQDPVAEWKRHTEVLAARIDKLNQADIKELRYKSPRTDLVIELPEGHIWRGGGIETDSGQFFVPNIPTEEVFTMPKRDGVNGRVKSTKPLNYGGQIIDDFEFSVKAGKIEDFKAGEGYDTLKSIIEADEGAARFGEVALVPDASPISDTGILFYNTLYDENASCHIAIGNAYPITIKGGTEMSEEEYTKHGVNHSSVHVDFMVGSSDLDIDALTRDGRELPLFRNGNWADEF